MNKIGQINCMAKSAIEKEAMLCWARGRCHVPCKLCSPKILSSQHTVVYLPGSPELDLVFLSVATCLPPEVTIVKFSFSSESRHVLKVFAFCLFYKKASTLCSYTRWNRVGTPREVILSREHGPNARNRLSILFTGGHQPV